MIPMLLRTCRVLCLVILSISGSEVNAQSRRPSLPSPNAPPSQPDATGHETVRGPAIVALLDQATLELPGGYVFLPRDAAARFLLGDDRTAPPSLVGMIAGGQIGPESEWFIAIGFTPAGFVKDDDVAAANPDRLAEDLRAHGTRQQQHGGPQVTVTGVVGRPVYDRSARQLSLVVRTGDRAVNLMTYAFGRDGYLGFNLVTDVSMFERDRAHQLGLLAAMTWRDGKRYGDFIARTDRVAPYGVGALMGGPLR
jgi:uncharacterized membrane-anchored protein